MAESAIEPVSARAHAFVAELDQPELAPHDRHHLERVLRLRTGDAVTISDGRGRWRACAFGDELAPLGPIHQEAELTPPLTVAFALVKGERPELVVQKLTELGIDRIVPFIAERSVVRWDETKAVRQRERLVSVAREAAMQCRRVWLPEISILTSFAEVAAMRGATLAARGGEPPSLGRPTVLVGPEGGWSDQELRVDLPRTDLGPHVLRAETAAITVAAVLSALRAGLITRNDHFA